MEDIWDKAEGQTAATGASEGRQCDHCDSSSSLWPASGVSGNLLGISSTHMESQQNLNTNRGWNEAFLLAATTNFARGNEHYDM